MGADDDMVAGFQKGFNDLSAVNAEQSAFAPGGSQQHSAGMLRGGAGGLESSSHLIHVGNANLHQFLFRQFAKLFQRAYLSCLILPGQEHGVVVVNTEHSVHGDVAGSVGNVDVKLHILRPFPLVDIQSRRGGQDDGGVEEIQLGKGLVTLADELRLHMGVRIFQRRVIFRRGHVDNIPAPPVHFPADRFEYVPIPLVVGENNKGNPFNGAFCLSAAQTKPKLDQQHSGGIDRRADDTDEDGEQHTPGAGVNVQIHIWHSLLTDRCLHKTAP